MLNRTSPFSIWINGERIDTLEQEGRRQNQEFRNLEEKYTEMEDGVENIFSDSMKVQKAAKIVYFLSKLHSRNNDDITIETTMTSL